MRSRDAYLYVNFPAIQVLNDPQGLAEKIFGTLKHSNERFEVRIMMMNFISRMISVHKLLLINFYPWIKRYLQPSQPSSFLLLFILLYLLLLLLLSLLLLLLLFLLLFKLLFSLFINVIIIYYL